MAYGNKKKSSKPKPSDLGTGAASKAAKKLKGRKSRMDAIIDAASTGRRTGKR